VSTASVLFFSTAKRKVPKESAAQNQIAPRDFGLALRCYVVLRKALLSGMALVFIPNRNLDLAFCFCMAVVIY
jgi:hypothetical protein